jgi:hypothetical protein
LAGSGNTVVWSRADFVGGSTPLRRAKKNAAGPEKNERDVIWFTARADSSVHGEHASQLSEPLIAR